MVEVLEGEMMFDMSKLQTRKSLKRLLHDEKRKRADKNVNNVSKNTDEQSKEQSKDSSGNMDNPIIEVSEVGKVEQENASENHEEVDASKTESDSERPASPLTLPDTSNIITP